MAKTQKLIAIVGPTASGKTEISIKLAKKFGGEIICADSRTIYKGMDIGTAKPSLSEQKLVSHYLLDVCNPGDSFSAADFKRVADKKIRDIQLKGKIPFLVGGSGMYIDAVLYGYSFRNIKSKQYIDELSLLSLNELQQRAKLEYPKKYSQIDNKNRRRLEQLLTKGPAKDNDRKKLLKDVLVIGIVQKEALLRQNIEVRTKKMLDNNLVQEAQALLKKYGEIDILKQTTGYAQVLDFLSGKINEQELQDKIVNATWQLSRKQMTWFRRNKSIIWVDSYKDAETHVNNYLS